MVADVIFWFVMEERLVVDVDVEEAAPVGVLLLDLSLTLFELPNQRLRRALNEVDWEVLLASSSSAMPFCSFCNAWVNVDVDSVISSGDGISTSSASRYHFLRRVYRSQPSWPRRPSFHCCRLVRY